MMGGVKLARRIQLGQETTAGNAVAATTYWRGMGVPDDQREVVFPEEHVGYISGVNRSYQPKLAAAMDFESVEATFEQLGHIFNASVQALQSTGDTSGSGTVHAATAPTSSVPEITAIKTYTIEGGDNQQAEELEYAFVDEWELSGAPMESLKVSASWLGRQITKASFTGALSIPTVEEILFGKGKLYIDDVSGTIGTTQVTSGWVGFTLSYKSGWRPVFTGDGNLYFTFAKQVGPEISLELKLEHDATGVSMRDAFKAGTAKQIRLLFEGSALTTAGTFTYKTLRLDMAGTFEESGPIEDDEGDDILPFTFNVRYDPTAALYFESVLVNEDSALP